jgi:hypothetical protein
VNDILGQNNRVLQYIEKVRAALASGQKADGSGPIDPASLPDLERTLAIEPFEHVAFQNAQAYAHAQGLLTVDEAMTVYTALGEYGSIENGGWAAGTDLATKVTITNLMGELIARQRGRR